MFTNLPGNETWQGYQMISILTSCTYCSDQRGVIRVKWVPFFSQLSGTIFRLDCSDYSNERNYLEYGMPINSLTTCEGYQDNMMVNIDYCVCN